MPIYKKTYLTEEYFKTYRIPLCSLERVIYFYKNGGYKFVKYGICGKVIDVIKSNRFHNIDRMMLERKSNTILKKYNVFNDSFTIETASIISIVVLNTKRR